MSYKYLGLIFSLILWQNLLQADQSSDANLCPLPQFTPDEIEIKNESMRGQGAPYEDKTRPIKDLGTDIVVNDFFSTPETLFNFMDIVYTSLNNALVKYKEENKLEDDSISLLFKGGNVLRIVANGIFDQVRPAVKKILEETYNQPGKSNFKRSDADFSVYIDEKKLGNLGYDKVFDDLSKLIYAELGKIREKFFKNPSKYFDFLRLTPEEAHNGLKKYFTELNELPIIEDKENDKWYHAKFKQIQLLDARAQKSSDCSFFGQFDYRFINKDDKIVGTPLSDKPSWIVNTDNRTPEFPLGSDPKKKIKFGLVRSKIAFEYTYEKDGKLYRKPIGGELIDVSIPHRLDHNVREFLDDYDQNIAIYTLKSPINDKKLTMKAYSLKYLADDLRDILFSSFDRPWNGGPKYKKRVNRIFFLFLTELLGTYGTGTKRAKDYITDVKEQILDRLKKLYPLDNNSKELGQKIEEEAKELSKVYPEMSEENSFWRAIADFINNRLIPKPDKENKDQEGFEEFLQAIEENISVVDKLNTMKITKVKPEEVYDADMNKLF